MLQVVNSDKVDPFEKRVLPVPAMGIEPMALIVFEVNYHNAMKAEEIRYHG